MIAEYEFTKDDLTAFNLFHNAHSPTARRQFYRSLVLPPAVWLLLCIGLWYLADQERGTPIQRVGSGEPLGDGPVMLVVIGSKSRWPVCSSRRAAQNLDTK